MKQQDFKTERTCHISGDEYDRSLLIYFDVSEA